MGILNSLEGTARLELTSADITDALRTINNMKIPVMDLRTISELTVQFTVRQRNLKQIERIAQQKGDRIVVLSHGGTLWTIRGVRKRPILLFGITILLVFSMFLPSRVLFVEVEGNEEIPANLIKEAAQSVGIGFGDSRREVRSEKMKNRLLGMLPQLQWAGVNTYGCTAVISVKEREIETQELQSDLVSHVVASCDGIITSCVVTAGSGLCRTGQVVQKGQILISGYTDCGGVITAGRSQGEVFAHTRHKISAVTPAEANFRDKMISRQVFYCLDFGKKRINFFKGSGISDGSCVKMITQYYLTLPGGYTLPVVLVKEERISFKSKSLKIDEAQLNESLSCFSREFIRESGVARVITEAQETLENKNGLILLRGIYSCTEMIGREQGVQIGDLHVKTD